MSSQGKKKTTMAKLNREARLRERKEIKRVRKERRLEGGPDVPDNAALAVDYDAQFPIFEEYPEPPDGADKSSDANGVKAEAQR